MPLPSVSQLLNYRRFTSSGSGWDDAALQRCAAVVKAAGADTRGGLAFDEMKIKSGLVFSVTTDELVGFTDLCVGAEAAHLSQLLEGEDPEADAALPGRTLATHVLQFHWTSLGERATRWGNSSHCLTGLLGIVAVASTPCTVYLAVVQFLGVAYLTCYALAMPLLCPCYAHAMPLLLT